jgi:SEL1 protein
VIPLHVSALSSTATALEHFDPIFDPNFVPTEEERENYRRNGGNDIVHELWSILRDFEPAWKESVSTPRPTRHAANAWYYTKVIFRLLFMNGPARQENYDEIEHPTVKGDLARAVDALKHASAFDDPDAIFLLAEMNFHGNFTHPRNHREAFKRYSQLAALDGNSTAQYMLGLMYATGIGGSVERNQAKALIFHTFAAEQGNIKSEMTLAFRHHSGIGTTRDCGKAVHYYKRIADKAMAYWNSGPPGGHTIPRNAYRWSENYGGVYGEGASASSSGPNAPKENTVSTEDYLELLEMRERQGDYTAILHLGQFAYDGRRGHRRNMRKAQKQFMKIARLYWGKDGKVNPKGPKGIDKIAAKAAAYIGRMFLRGEGMEQNFGTAATWFRRGIVNGDPFAQYHMGIMHRDGLGMPKDSTRAAACFKAAAEQNLSMAQSALGVLFLDQGDLDTASRYFELAALQGNMEAFYYLAELNNKGVGREQNCGVAVLYYKAVVERVEILHSSFAEANMAYENGDFERALIVSVMAAEQGYESAQANVAYLLDKNTSVLSLPTTLSIPFFNKAKPRQQPSLLHNPSLALIYFTRSAKQANTDSLVKLGDYYLLGTGTEDSLPNLDKAATCYTTAAESHQSAQSLWNLGWMHENGVAVTQDFHMAKRYYDLALELNKEAYLPVKLALGKLYIRSWWNGVSGGKVNPIRHEPDDGIEGRKSRTFTEWLAHFLDAADEMDAQEAAAMAEDMELGGGGGGDFGSDAMPGGDEAYYDDFDDGLVESLIIIGLAATLGFLVYYRQQRQLAGQRAREQAQVQAQAQTQGQQQVQDGGQIQGQDQDRGLFPNPGDPDWNQWVAGGIGH